MLKLLFFIMGAIVGSFLNVCIYRMPRSESIVSPRSHCVHCGTLIRWHENIPFVSYILLKGKCGKCKRPISPRYFVVELLTAVLFVLFYMKFGFTLNLAFFLILLCGLMIATFIDLQYQLIPDSVSLGGLALALITGLAFPGIFGAMSRKAALLFSLGGAAMGGLSTLAISYAGKILFRQKLRDLKEDAAMGFGDVKFLAMIGAFIGWQKVLLVFFLAPFFGAAVGIVLKLRYKLELIPYGPYLSLATVIAILLGEEILGKLFYM
ncbi:MAG: prepilin peptidase [Candidatus Omnitrophica bacterium]|nr:prepilin peptidase [Candidatus Omnitrophota bacterium]